MPGMGCLPKVAALGWQRQTDKKFKATLGHRPAF